MPEQSWKHVPAEVRTPQPAAVEAKPRTTEVSEKLWIETQASVSKSLSYVADAHSSWSLAVG